MDIPEHMKFDRLVYGILLLFSFCMYDKAVAKCDWLLPSVSGLFSPTLIVGEFPYIESANLILRPFDPKRDSPAGIREFLSAPDIQADLGVPSTLRELRNWMKNFSRNLSRGIFFQHEETYNNDVIVTYLPIFQKSAGNQLVGIVTLREYVNAQVDGFKTLPLGIGYAIAPRFRQRGYAVEAARALIEYVQTQHPGRVIFARVKSDNTVSRRVLEKLGMKFWAADDDFIFMAL